MNNRRFSARVRTALGYGCGAVVVSGQLLVGGCYRYSVPGNVAPQPGSHVSIRLSNDASRDLALKIGPGVTYVEGVVLGDDSAGLHLAVSHVEGRAGGSSSSWAGEHFIFPHDTYLSLEVRHLSVPGTVLIGGLGVAAVVAMSQAFGTSTASSAPGPGVTNPSQ